MALRSRVLADAAPQSNMSILIHDGRTAAEQPGRQMPDGASVIDLANEIENRLTRNDINRAFDGAVFARRMLQQGATSARAATGRAADAP